MEVKCLEKSLNSLRGLGGRGAHYVCKIVWPPNWIRCWDILPCFDVEICPQTDNLAKASLKLHSLKRKSTPGSHQLLRSQLEQLGLHLLPFDTSKKGKHNLRHLQSLGSSSQNLLLNCNFQSIQLHCILLYKYGMGEGSLFFILVLALSLSWPHLPFAGWPQCITQDHSGFGALKQCTLLL